MLNITNPPLVTQTSLQNTSEAGLFLKVNQHVAGEVIKVENEHVVLSIQGVQVVARMTTPEQIASLVERRYAQFIVKEMSGDILTLQLIDSKAAPSQLTASQHGTQLLSKLLTQTGIADNADNQLIAGMAIRHGLTISPALIKELGTTLSNIPNWGMEHAQAAAALRSNGISVTPQSINLMLNAGNDISGQIQNLMQQLSRLIGSNQLPANLAELARSSLQVLRQAVIDPSLPQAELAARLHNAIALLGKTVEKELLDSIKDPLKFNLDNQLERGLMVLSKLQNGLAARGLTSLAGGIEKFNESIRMMHLFHAASTSEGNAAQWIRMEFPVSFPQPGQPESRNPEEETSAYIRIARNPDDEEISINSQYTRLVIHMEIDGKDSIEVDLSVVEQAASLSISTTNPRITSVAKTELPVLQDGLAKLGYDTKVSQVETDMTLHLHNPKNLDTTAREISGINVEA